MSYAELVQLGIYSTFTEMESSVGHGGVAMGWVGWTKSRRPGVQEPPSSRQNSLPKTVTRQRRGCDLNPGPSPKNHTTPATTVQCSRRRHLLHHLRSNTVRVAVPFSIRGENSVFFWTEIPGDAAVTRMPDKIHGNVRCIRA